MNRAVIFVVVLGLGASGCAFSQRWPRERVVVSACTPSDLPAGTLLVRVVDAAGLPMPGTVVQARVGRRTPVSRGTTDASGLVTLSVTPPSSRYEVTASLPGFYPSSVKDLRVTPGCTTELRLPLRIAPRPRAAVPLGRLTKP